MTCLLNARTSSRNCSRLGPTNQATRCLCVCAVKPYFYNIQQFEHLARGLRTRQPVKLVPDQPILLARHVTTTNRTVVSD